MAYNQNPIKPRNKCFSHISDQYRDLFLDQEKKKKCILSYSGQLTNSATFSVTVK